MLYSRSCQHRCTLDHVGTIHRIQYYHGASTPMPNSRADAVYLKVIYFGGRMAPPWRNEIETNFGYASCILLALGAGCESLQRDCTFAASWKMFAVPSRGPYRDVMLLVLAGAFAVDQT